MPICHQYQLSLLPVISINYRTVLLVILAMLLVSYSRLAATHLGEYIHYTTLYSAPDSEDVELTPGRKFCHVTIGEKKKYQSIMGDLQFYHSGQTPV